MRTVIMTKDELQITVDNGRWFAGFKCRWTKIGDDHYRVRTNYIPAGVR